MQTLQRISEAERRFLIDGIVQGLRNDGRGLFDYRRVSFEIGTIPTASGSCRLRAGATDILVGVKCEISKVARERPDIGHFHVTVECASSVSKRFAEGRDGEDWGRHLSVILESLCAGEDVVDRRALCLAPGVFCWQVHVDILVLASGGNLLDSASLALCAALSQTLLPRVEVVDAVEEGETVQLKVDDRPEVGTAFPLKKTPLCVTVAQVQDRFLLDVTSEEEVCADAMICVVVDGKRGDVIGLHKLGRGLFNVASLPGILARCKNTAAALARELDRELALRQKTCT